MQKPLNVVCLKWGDKYPADYVNRLYKMVNRHLTRPFKFYCLTECKEGLLPAIHQLPLETSDLVGWWYKLSLFKKNFYGLEGDILYLDLDDVIVNNIDFLAEQPGDFLICIDWTIELMWNSSVMRFQAGQHSHIWESFLENKESVLNDYNGDQEWIFECVPSAGNWPVEKVVSYKKSLKSKAYPLIDKLKRPELESRLKALKWFDTKLPPAAAVVVFHGKPDPEDVADKPYGRWKRASFVNRFWC